MTRVLLYVIWPIIALNVISGFNLLFDHDFVNGPTNLLIASMLAYMVTSDDWNKSRNAAPSGKDAPDEARDQG